MEIIELCKYVDHTLLDPGATWMGIKEVLEDGIKYKTASACIPPAFVQKATDYVQGRLPICTVVGFPNGYMTTETKVFETKDAIDKGAKEIDMVINLGLLKSGNYELVTEEIRQIKACCGDRILKVIIETCLLTEEEKIRMCRIVTDAGADFIKTSTGFSTSGATREDIILFKKHIGSDIKIKAAGGISTIQDAEDFIALGADRLGTSRIIKLLKAEKTDNYY